jgi:MFS family permease
MTAAILRLNERTFVSLKRSRNYRLFFSGQIVSVTGTWMQRIAQAWLILQLTHNSAVAVGFMAFAQFLPFTIFGLFAGTVVDRLDAHRTVIATQTGAMLCSAAIAALALAGVARPWEVYAIAAVNGTIMVLDAPARQALTFRMVGRQELSNAVALNSSLFNASRIFGPGIGGLLIAAVGVGWCFAANAASFLAVIAGLLLMRKGEFHPVERREPPSIFRGTVQGLQYVREHRRALILLALTLIVSTFSVNNNVLLPVLAKQTLHQGAQTFGVLSALFGAGALLGALLSAGLGRASTKWLLTGGTVFTGAQLLVAPERSVYVIGLLLFISGVGFTLWSSNTNSSLQLQAPDHLRGRVVGLYFFAFTGTGPFGGLLAGWLAKAGGTELAFLVAGAAGLTAIALATSRLRASVPQHVPEPAVESAVEAPRAA